LSRVVGERAEALASAYLKRLGYTLVEQNFCCPQGEIDIIAWDADVLCFVEVRGRSDVATDPLATLGPQKLRRVVAAARVYLANWRGARPLMRFDAVAVTLATPPTLRLLRDAFEV
jgi:putative endonuclease